MFHSVHEAHWFTVLVQAKTTFRQSRHIFALFQFAYVSKSSISLFCITYLSWSFLRTGVEKIVRYRLQRLSLSKSSTYPWSCLLYFKRIPLLTQIKKSYEGESKCQKEAAQSYQLRWAQSAFFKSSLIDGFVFNC